MLSIDNVFSNDFLFSQNAANFTQCHQISSRFALEQIDNIQRLYDGRRWIEFSSFSKVQVLKPGKINAQ
jgi:hypothetical protein